jgi:uncharacterized membrane protein YvbJ
MEAPTIMDFLTALKRRVLGGCPLCGSQNLSSKGCSACGANPEDVRTLAELQRQIVDRILRWIALIAVSLAFLIVLVAVLLRLVVSNGR